MHDGRLHGDQHSAPMSGDRYAAIWVQPYAREQRSMGKSWLVVEKCDRACVSSFAFPLKSILAGAQTTISDPTIHDTIPVVISVVSLIRLGMCEAVLLLLPRYLWVSALCSPS